MPPARRRKTESSASKPDATPDATPNTTPDNPPNDAAPNTPAQQAPSSQQDDVVALLREIRTEQQQHRAEVAELREQLNEAKAARVRPGPSSVARSAEELEEERAAEIAEHQFYCYACGRLYDRERECSGSGEAPHPPLDVIPTKELTEGDKSKHTAAPGTNP